MSERFTPEERALLSPWVTSLDAPVFALKNLPEEVVAVLFAYYSRSESGLRANLLSLLQDQTLGVDAPAQGGAELALARERARAFHEKWVVGYGHASVAEHAVVHLALEDVSIVASKVVEDMRLASYTEKSTRYVQFDKGRCHLPQGLVGTDVEAVYRGAMDHLFTTYTDLIEPMTREIMTAYPPQPGQRPKAVERACRARALDALRAILPASTLTNLGLTLNGRAAAHLIAKLGSHPLPECRALGEAMRHHAEQILPTLVKYAEPRPYLTETPGRMASLAAELLGPLPGADVSPHALPASRLVRLDGDPEAWLVASILFRHRAEPLAAVYERVRVMGDADRARVVDAYLAGRGPHDAPLRELEHVACTVDVLVDYGAYRDIQRHRIATQTPQALSFLHGYTMPEEFEIFGLTGPFKEAMEVAAGAWERIRRAHPEEAAYVVPLAARTRVAFTWNLREVFHFIELRSAPQGHRSYRRVAQQIYREVEAAWPLLARYIRVTMGDAALGRLQAEERAEARREALRDRGVDA